MIVVPKAVAHLAWHAIRESTVNALVGGVLVAATGFAIERILDSALEAAITASVAVLTMAGWKFLAHRKDVHTPVG